MVERKNRRQREKETVGDVGESIWYSKQQYGRGKNATIQGRIPCITKNFYFQILAGGHILIEDVPGVDAHGNA